MVMIVLNALVIGFETVEEYKQAHSNVFKALDEFFLAIYTMEFLMKLYAEPRGYWKSSYNIFDFSILALSYVQVIMDELNVGDKILTPLRLLREACLSVTRTLRTISFIEGLQVLVMALIDTIRNSVLNVVILLTMLMAFFAVVGYYIFGYDEETGDKENWGTLSTAMLTLFTFVTNNQSRGGDYQPKPKAEADNPYRDLDDNRTSKRVHEYDIVWFELNGRQTDHDLDPESRTKDHLLVDGWTEIQKDLDKRPYSQWFTIIFIFLGHFIFMNLFIGIIIMNIHEATEKFIAHQRQEREAVLQMKKDFLYQRQHDDVRRMLEKQKNSQYRNFEEMTHSFQQTLRHDDFVIMSDPCTNLTWIEAYLTTSDHLDIYMHRCQQIQFQIANVLADMAEMNMNEKEQEPSSSSPGHLQSFKTKAKASGISKKMSS
ncbi:Cation channel sperm-associated protein 3 [Acropora cervicornis]|uniref:Cation channel sperm-associated protein 3 n=1 Tax=Acropora cervicornis TaxID=6130 RepID=A0AAD9QA63_ACRCE|nr:Cation channel sperm-associated protein 3 [Acropora cervicornis]